MTGLSGLRRLLPAAALLGMLAVLAAPRAVSAQPSVVVVLPASGTNVSASYIHTARAVLVGRLGEHVRVVDLDRPSTPVPPSPALAAETARHLGGKEAVVLDVSRAGGITRFTLVTYDAATALARTHLQEATRAGPEVITIMAERLVFRLVTGTAPWRQPSPGGAPPESSERTSPVASAGNPQGAPVHVPAPTAAAVTAPSPAAPAPVPSPAAPPAAGPAPPLAPAPKPVQTMPETSATGSGSRRPGPPPPAPPGSGISLGFRLGLTGQVQNPKLLPSVGVFLLRDTVDLLADVFVELATLEGDYLASVGAGAYLALSEASSAPYLGLTLEWTSAETDGVRARGMTFTPTLGYCWGRSAEVRMRAEAGYFVHLFAGGGPGARAGHGPLLQVGLAI